MGDMQSDYQVDEGVTLNQLHIINNVNLAKWYHGEDGGYSEERLRRMLVRAKMQMKHLKELHEKRQAVFDEIVSGIMPVLPVEGDEVEEAPIEGEEVELRSGKPEGGRLESDELREDRSGYNWKLKDGERPEGVKDPSEEELELEDHDKHVEKLKA